MNILIAGGGGLLGSALSRRLEGRGDVVRAWRRSDGDLRTEAAAAAAVCERAYDVVYLTAATQGGISDHLARPLAYLEDNARIAINVIKAAADAGTPRLIYAATTMLYGAATTSAFREEDLCREAPDAAHAPYALAKQVGLGLCELYARDRGLQFSAAILTNMFGAGSTFDPERATVAPSLVRRAVDARRAGAAELVVWGSGRASRDLLPAQVAADAMIHLAQHQTDAAPVNVAAGVEFSMQAIAQAAAKAAGFTGRVAFDPSKPEGVLSRPIDISRLRALGFEPRFDLDEAMAVLARAYEAQADAGKSGAPPSA